MYSYWLFHKRNNGTNSAQATIAWDLINECAEINIRIYHYSLVALLANKTHSLGALLLTIFIDIPL